MVQGGQMNESATGTPVIRQRGVNRVVMAVRDLDAGRIFYERLLGCTFHHGDDEEAARFGVRVLFSWDGGVELVAPIEGADSHIETIIAEKGEGLIGVVWAVADADASKAAAEEQGAGSFFTLDYSQEEIDDHLQGRFRRYYEHFLAGADSPLGSASVLVGEFDVPA
jgi:methylmalonyl-CoA/ethylmalonyl-CoA epimerase